MMRLVGALIAALLIALVLQSPAYGQVQVAPDRDLAVKRLRDLNENPALLLDSSKTPFAVNTGPSANGTLLPTPPDPKLTNSDTDESYRSAYRDYLAYRKHGLEHRLRVYEWQLGCSTTIFIVVLILVATGIFFAGVQFFHAQKNGPGIEDAHPTTVFSAGPNGVRVSSPVLGVIILAVSLAFFYLYLVYVYPISEAL